MRTHTELSRLGRAAAIAALGCLLGALLVEHPWPRWVCAFLGSLFVLSALSRGSPRQLRFERLAPARTTEGQRLVLGLSVRHRGRGPVWVGRIRAHSGEIQIPVQSLALVRGRDEVPVEVHAHARGRASSLALEWSSRQPFGLLVIRGEAVVECEVWVFPSPRALRESVLEQMLSLRPQGSDLPQPTGPGDAEFYSLREWREGESERRVHPRITARRGRKILQVFRGEAPPVLDVVLDLRVGTGRGFGGPEFEDAVRFVAGLLHSMQRRSIPVRLWLHGESELREAAAPDDRGIGSNMAVLALARPVVADGRDAPLPAVRGRGVLVHLGTWSSEASERWLLVRAGSKTFFQLLQPWEQRAVASS